MKIFGALLTSGILILLCVPSDALDENTNNPHYTSAFCDACHQSGKQPALIDENPVSLCTRCHNEEHAFGDHHSLNEVPEKFPFPGNWPLRDGKLTCMTCHLHCTDDYRSKYKFLRGDAHQDKQAFCAACHPPESFAKRNPHEEINRNEGCELCHKKRPEPGVDTLATVTFLSNPTSLCLLCHDNLDHPAAARHTHILSDDEIESISGEVVLYKGKEIVCSTCHNPHVYESGNAKFRAIAIKSFACPGCHKV